MMVGELRFVEDIFVVSKLEVCVFSTYSDSLSPLFRLLCGICAHLLAHCGLAGVNWGRFSLQNRGRATELCCGKRSSELRLSGSMERGW